MSEITLIEPQKKDKLRCNVYVDGRFYCGIKLEVAVRYRLKVGMHIDLKKLDEIQLETEKSQALDKALNYLSAIKTKRQVRDYLEKKGYTQAVILYVLEKLEYYNYVDDEAYCRAYINCVSGKGKRAIEAELLKRGVERSVISSVLDEVEEDENEVFALLKKYMRGKENSRENLYKGFKYLLSKGFAYDTAKSALDSYDIDNEDN